MIVFCKIRSQIHINFVNLYKRDYLMKQPSIRYLFHPSKISLRIQCSALSNYRCHFPDTNFLSWKMMECVLSSLLTSPLPPTHEQSSWTTVYFFLLFFTSWIFMKFLSTKWKQRDWQIPGFSGFPQSTVFHSPEKSLCGSFAICPILPSHLWSRPSLW